MSTSGSGGSSLMDKWMAGGGAVIVILVVGFMAADTVERSINFRRTELLIFTIGWLMNLAGTWNASSRMMSGRRYLKLREEVGNFIELVRHLNAYKVSGNEPKVEDIKDLMHESVEKMADVAAAVDS